MVIILVMIIMMVMIMDNNGDDNDDFDVDHIDHDDVDIDGDDDDDGDDIDDNDDVDDEDEDDDGEVLLVEITTPPCLRTASGSSAAAGFGSVGKKPRGIMGCQGHPGCPHRGRRTGGTHRHRRVHGLQVHWILQLGSCGTGGLRGGFWGGDGGHKPTPPPPWGHWRPLPTHSTPTLVLEGEGSLRVPLLAGVLVPLLRHLLLGPGGGAGGVGGHHRQVHPCLDPPQPLHTPMKIQSPPPNPEGLIEDEEHLGHREPDESSRPRETPPQNPVPSHMAKDPDL